MAWLLGTPRSRADRGQPRWLWKPRLLPRQGQSEDTGRSSLLRRPKGTAMARTVARARAMAGRSAGLDRTTRTSHTSECSSRATATMRRESSESGKVSSPGHAKGPASVRPRGHRRGGTRRPNRPRAWKRPRAEWPGPRSPERRDGRRGESLVVLSIAQQGARRGLSPVGWDPATSAADVTSSN
jgi:hypothetical protein